MTQEIARIKVVTTGWIGAPGLSQFYFSPTTGTVITPADALNAAAAVRSFYFAIHGNYPTTWTATVQPVVQVIEATTGALLREVAVTPPATVPGITGSAYGATASGIVASWHTSMVFGKHLLRGRTFLLPNIPACFNTQGQIDSGSAGNVQTCLLYTSPSPRDRTRYRMPSSA